MVYLLFTGSNFRIVGAYIIDIIVLIISFVIITGKSALRFSIRRKKYMKQQKKAMNVIRSIESTNKKKKQNDVQIKNIVEISLDNKIEKEDSVTSDEMGELHPQMELECPVVEEESIQLWHPQFFRQITMATGFRKNRL